MADSEVAGAELLLVSHPLAFLEGSMGQPPAVEDLHVALIESNPGPIVNKIFSYLPRKPIAVPATPAASAAATPAGASPAADLQQPEPAAATPLDPEATPAAPAAPATPAVTTTPQQEPNPPQVPPSLAHLVVQFWDQLGPGGYGDAPPLSSRQLMRMLQASSWSEEFQDPAASQVGRTCNQGCDCLHRRAVTDLMCLFAA